MKKLKKMLKDFFDPCNLGFHKDEFVSESFGTGVSYNNLTGSSHRVPCKSSLWKCSRCGRMSGQMVSAEGQVANFTGTQLEILVRNTGLKGYIQ